MSRILRYALLSLCLSWLGATGLWLHGQTPGANSPEIQQRLKLFNRVWELIHDEHYNPRFAGKGWDDVRERYLPLVLAAHDREGFYQVLREMAWETDSSHTAFLPTYNGHEGNIGLLLKRLTDHVYISKVLRDSPADHAGLRVGDEIRTVDSTPAAALHINPVESELRGEVGSELTLELVTVDGKSIRRSLRREHVDLDLPIEWRRLPSGVGYIRIYNFSDLSRVAQFRAAYDQLHDAPGLIIDVRGPNGGLPYVVGSILGYFLNRVEMMTFRDRKGHFFKSYTVPHDNIYQGRLVVVIDERSRSGQEIFANTLKLHQRAVLVGTRSCGCVEGGNYIRLSDREVLELAHYAVLTPQGGRLEAIGIEPDRTVLITKEDLARGSDPQLMAAEDELRRQLSAAPRAATGLQ